MIEARDLSFGYSDRVVGAGMNFTVARGEVFCLLGPNGCGKTTLFRTVLGLLPALGGTLKIEGKSVPQIPRRQLARMVAYVPQASVTYFPFSVLEVVLMGRASWLPPFQGPSSADRRLAYSMLEEMRIAHLAGSAYTAISGGERQLTLIARALSQQASFLVMDEPTASLDFGNQGKVIERIIALKNSRLGVVLSTHEPSHAFWCADTVALMKNGTIFSKGSPEAVLTSTSLEELYRIPVTVTQIAQNGQGVCVPLING